jgi:hypothetical protein
MRATGIRSFVAVIGVLAAPAGCSSSTAPYNGPTGVYTGVFAGTIASGVLTIDFPSASVAASRSRFSLVRVAEAASGPVSIAGTLALAGGGSIPLSGTYSASANPELSVSGGGYTISGSSTSGATGFHGTFTGPSASAGGWSIYYGGLAPKDFCGSFALDVGSAGKWFMVLDSANDLSGDGGDSASSSFLAMSGSYTPSTKAVNLSVETYVLVGGVYEPTSSGSAGGTLDPVTGAGSGPVSFTGGGSGTWSVHTCN